MTFVLALTLLFTGIPSEKHGNHSSRHVQHHQLHRIHSSMKSCPGIVRGINWYRSKTWGWQRKLGVSRSRAEFQTFHSCPFARWTARLWIGRAHEYRIRYWTAVKARAVERRRVMSLSVPDIICQVFGSACGKAQAVAACESGYSVYATNGQYYGIFQMGSSERARYGGSSNDPWEQVRAAYAYYSDAGWSRWQCA